MGGSTEGPIYSTIDATSEDLHSFTYSTTPYASTSIMPVTNQIQAPAHSCEQQDNRLWTSEPGPSGAQYAQPDRCNGEVLARTTYKCIRAYEESDQFQVNSCISVSV